MVKYYTLRSTPVRKPIDRDPSQNDGFIEILKAQVSLSQNCSLRTMLSHFGSGLSS
jgi:hypothetical protein